MLRAAALFIAGMLGLMLMAELVLQCLPVSTATMTGYHDDPDLLTYPPRHCWQVATGWDLRNAQRLCSNAQGYAAEVDFIPDPRAVALIGDSLVEASMLPAADRPGAQLARRLHAQRPVYSMGAPGSALLDYAQRIRWAATVFGVRDFVLLLEATDARQSLCGSGNVHSRCLDLATLALRVERLAPPGPAKRAARHSALAQYLMGQLKLQPGTILQAAFRRATPESAAATVRQTEERPSAAQVARQRQVVDAVTAAFFEAARPHLAGRLVVLVDGRRGGPPAKPTLVDSERAHLIERLRAGGAEVIDLEPAYAAHWAASRRSLDVGPYDGHLNRLGVGIAMQAAAEVLAR